MCSNLTIVLLRFKFVIFTKCNGEGKCPPCPGCPEQVCECTAPNGELFIPPPPPPQPTQPSDCPACITGCPRITCTSPTTPCTALQLDTYLACPACVAQAGCRQEGCECKDCLGHIFSPPTNPPQPPRPSGCPQCSTACIVSLIKCEAPVLCTQEQLETYVEIIPV